MSFDAQADTFPEESGKSEPAINPYDPKEPMPSDLGVELPAAVRRLRRAEHRLAWAKREYDRLEGYDALHEFEESTRGPASSEVWASHAEIRRAIRDAGFLAAMHEGRLWLGFSCRELDEDHGLQSIAVGEVAIVIDGHWLDVLPDLTVNKNDRGAGD